ncbi:HlyD family secretion protein [Povalibacter sp.]|uniref:HlyD family secretion protein n=1 Tax=Povalibacter sp. TaxID=1962978 RepID=UPI002F41B865
MTPESAAHPSVDRPAPQAVHRNEPPVLDGEPAVPASDASEPASDAPAKPARDPVKTVTLGVLITLATLFIYHVVSDGITPYTSQGNIEVFLVQIAPRVTGQVIEVGARDNEHVKKGQILYRIDPEPFEIAVRAAEANLALAAQGVSVSTADVRSMEATLAKQKTDLEATQVLSDIVFGLTREKALSESDSIKAQAEIDKSKADVARGEAELERARQQLGPVGKDNPKMQQARVALEQARLDLQYATVIAPADGVITNLRLSVGQFVSRGQPGLSFIDSDSVWLTAYLRENQLRNVAPGNEARVAFDFQPGRVFSGRVESVGWGIAKGGEAPAGTLPEVQSDKGWVRDPQRFPVRIALVREGNAVLDDLPLRNGAQANVLILTDPDSWLLNPLGRAWLRIISLLRYIY